MKRKIHLKYAIIGSLVLIIVISFAFLELQLFIDYKEKLNYYYLAKYMNKEISDNIDVNALSTSEPQTQKTDRMIKLEELHSQNEDIVAWLEISRYIYRLSCATSRQ